MVFHCSLTLALPFLLLHSMCLLSGFQLVVVFNQSLITVSCFFCIQAPACFGKRPSPVHTQMWLYQRKKVFFKENKWLCSLFVCFSKKMVFQMLYRHTTTSGGPTHWVGVVGGWAVSSIRCSPLWHPAPAMSPRPIATRPRSRLPTNKSMLDPSDRLSGWSLKTHDIGAKWYDYFALVCIDLCMFR